MNLDKAIQDVQSFQGPSLTDNLAKLEQSIVGSDISGSMALCSENNIDADFMNSALAIKGIAGQINVIIHASGILQSLSSILKQGEIVESVSLGAGNTGKKFDLETNLRIAEYKFIDWKGGAESIRQNGIFKDFYELAEYKTDKMKVLYVVDTFYPLKFFNSRRKLDSILAKQPTISQKIIDKYGCEMTLVSDYYKLHQDKVMICDVRQYVGR